METIQVVYRQIYGSAHHKYLLYTDSDGNQQSISIFPEYDMNTGAWLESVRNRDPFGPMKVDDGPYTASRRDHPHNKMTENKDRHYETIATDADLSDEWNTMLDFAREIEANEVGYDLLERNSNTAVDEALRRAGLPAPKFDTPDIRDPERPNLPALNDDPYPDYSAPASGRPWDWRPHRPFDWFFDGLDDLREGLDNILDSLTDALRGLFAPLRDPLALDLDGDGIETIGTDGSVVMFDHDADGVKTGTGWLTGDDAWLVLDKNGNGVIDTGRELFGVDTVLANGTTAADGFAALREHDVNQDGVVNTADGVFSQLRLWRDLNRDGVSQEHELTSLGANGIVSVGVQATSIRTDLGNGNVQTAAGTFTRSDGSSGVAGETSSTAANLNLATNTFFSEFTTRIPLTEQAKALPDIRGSGRVRDLREAMSLSPTLANIVESYSQQTTRSGQLALLDQLVQAWADTADVGSLKQQANSLATQGAQVSVTYSLEGLTPGTPAYEAFLHKLGVVERFMGFTYAGPTGGIRTEPLDANSGSLTVSLAREQIANISRAYDKYSAGTYEYLLLDTRLKPYYDKVYLTMQEGVLIDTDMSHVEGMFRQAIAASPQQGVIDMVEFVSALGRGRAAMFDWNARAFLFEELNKVEGLSSFSAELGAWTVRLAGAGEVSPAGTARSDLIVAAHGNDHIQSGAGDDILLGRGGNDNLYGGDGTDVLDGGAGTDYLSGGNGDDRYRFGRGYGQDTIYNHDADPAGEFGDFILMGEGVAASDVRATRSGEDLVLSIVGTTDSLRVQYYFSQDGASPSAVPHVYFADGTTWDVAAIKAMVVVPTAGNDTLYGYATDDVLNGLEGNDTLYGAGGADTLEGGAGDDNLQGQDGNDLLLGGVGTDSLSGGSGADDLQGQDGNDYLYGDAGNDVFDGGAGNDYLSGGSGADLYRFGGGSGSDTVYNHDGDAVGVNADTISFAADVLPADVTMQRSGEDLVLSIAGTTDSLRVQSYFSQDGSSQYAVETIQFADGTAWDVAAIKGMVVQPTAGNDTLYGYATDEVLSGLEGNDTIYGAAGADTLEGGAGDDNLQGQDGNDLLLGGIGGDSLSGGNGADDLRGEAGNDYLYGDGGNDIFDGGAGNDYLSGGSGADVYRFGRGSGSDTVYNHDGDAVGVNADTISFAADVLPADVSVRRSGEDLVLSIAGTTDSLRVQSYFSQDGASQYAVESIQFADGTAWDVAAIKSMVTVPTAGNDTLYGYATDDVLTGLEGNDTIYAAAGADTLEGGAGDDNLQGQDGNDLLKGGIGGDSLSGGNGADDLQGEAGNDYLYGDAGNDVFDGGAGNDYLSGGTGADVYRFGRGYGSETVYNHDGDAVGVNADTISFAADVLPANVTVRRSGEDLLLSINGTTDSLRVQSYFSQDGASQYAVESIQFADGTAWDVAAIKAMVVVPTAGNDTLYGYATDDVFNGLEGNDTIYGAAGADTLEGGAGDDNLQGQDGNDLLKGGIGGDSLSGGNGADDVRGEAGDDYLYGDGGNDVFDGGTGNDYLSGGSGADVYRFGRGYGSETVYNHDGDALGVNADTISFAAGIATSEVTAKRSGEDLLLSINGTTDSLRVQSYFSQDGTSQYAVENIQFADGTVWDITTIKAKVVEPTSGTAGNDTLYGYATDDVLHGLGGNDTIYGAGGADTLDGGTGDDNLQGQDGNDLLKGGIGNDSLSGGNGADDLQGEAGNDYLYGDAGNDVFDGGAGNDYLSGGSGADVYRFGRGYGSETVYNHDGDAVGVNADTVSFAADVIPANVTVRRSGEDLVLAIAGTTDSLRVQSYFSQDGASQYAVESIQFADGTVWNVAAIKSMVTVPTTGNDTLYGYATDDVLTGLEGNDTIYAAAGADTLEGGAGDDNLQGQDGNDLLKAGIGNDSLSGGN
ncbi:MAG TPA: calcium-binding protein, partial [Longimicrobium sp.]|uniref:calcium-binding protein n=1 Tax=Longimicrobium sp. TaxID=2029185 RepID=UPI002EDA5F5D